MKLRYYAKRLLQRAANLAGYDLVPKNPDVVLLELLQTQEELHRHAGDVLRWGERLPHAAAHHHLRELLRLHRIDLVVDVGANRGQFGKLIRKLGYRGEIVSFEPQSAIRESLAHAAGLDGNWQVRPEAVAARSGEAVLHLYASDFLSSLHEVSPDALHRTSSDLRRTGTETVPLISLDEIWPQLTKGSRRRVLLKTDTQGHDQEVFRGCTESLPDVQAVMTEGSAIPIYQESPRFPEIMNHLEGKGFAISGIFPIAHRAHDLALIEVDCYFTRPAK